MFFKKHFTFSTIIMPGKKKVALKKKINVDPTEFCFLG